MRKRLVAVTTLLPLLLAMKAHCATATIQKPSHLASGTSFGEEGVKTYVQQLHGPDGEVLLDPYILPLLKSASGQTLLDAGCGSAIWAAIAAQHGAKVYACDRQGEFIRKAHALIAEYEVEDSVALAVEDLTHLPYRDNLVDLSLSLFEACNLPSDAFIGHLQEMVRVTKPGGEIVVAAPHSLDHLFTTGLWSDEEAAVRVQEAIEELPPYPTSSEIAEALHLFRHVLRASFQIDPKGNLSIIRPGESLKPGQAIWRKLPSVVVPNFYYTKAEYLAALEELGLEIIEVREPLLQTEDRRTQLPAIHLGVTYEKKAPFLLIRARKRI